MDIENLEDFRRPEVDMRNDLPKEPDGLGKLSWYEIIGVVRGRHICKRIVPGQ